MQNLIFHESESLLMWDPLSPNCVDKYRVIVEGQEIETKDTALHLNFMDLSVCKEISAIVTPSVPCGGFLESSKSERLTFILPPEGEYIC